MPEIDYAPAPPFSRFLWKQRARHLAEILLERFGGNGAVWWVHNYHLGKNPLLTEALLHIAALADGPRMILQPHDFPEAGRYDNLRALDRSITAPLYPCGPRVRYALINRRDLGLLKRAGLPESCLFLLENPVARPETAPRHEDRRALRSRLSPGSDPAHPTLLYPVRCIRRKNVLEAGLMLRLVDAPLRLIVTLPGVSDAERAYSNLVEGAFRSGLIPGELSAGLRLADLGVDQMAAACDIVVCSSVQEGFGYLFVQALQWGLPLLARRLDTTPGSDGLYDGYPAHFYTSFPCPVEAAERKALQTRYGAKLKRLTKLAPADAVGKLNAELQRIFAFDAVDFSFLDPALQLRLLRAAAEKSDFRSELKRRNQGLAVNLEALLAERPQPRIQAVDQSFGLAAYASRVDHLLESFDHPAAQAQGAHPAKVQQRMRAAFLDAHHLRLLFD